MCNSNKLWRNLQAVIFITILITINIGKTEQQKCANVPEEEEAAEEYQHDISLIFYYVSWAQDNLAVLKIYDEIATDYGQYMQFINKDCYQLSCNCSRIYSNPAGNPLSMKRWPVLEVFHANDYMLRYTGQWNYGNLARFMESLLQPVLRLNNQQQLQALSSRHDAIILAYFPNISNFKLNYIQFIASAYQFLEYDAQESFKFAISLGVNLAPKLFAPILDAPQIYLLTSHNHSKALNIFPENKTKANWKLSKLLHWLQIIWLKLKPKLYASNSPTKLALQLREQPVLAVIMHKQNFFKDFKYYDVGKKIYEGQCRNDFLQIFYNNHIENLNYFNFLNNKIIDLSLINARKTRLRVLAQKSFREAYIPTELRIGMIKFMRSYIDVLLTNNASNKTLAVVLLDAEEHMDFLQKQQINSSAFIADNEEESIYKLEKLNTFENLIKFVQDYLTNNLQTHQLQSQLNDHYQYKEYVRQVNSSTFLQQYQNDSDKSTIVLFLFAKNCAFCNIMLQALQQIAAILIMENSNLNFLSINLHTNNLPWQLNVPNTPTLMVFPQGKFSESRQFPNHLRINVRNIFAFILAQLEPLQQLQLTLKMCQHKMMPHMRTQNCLQFEQQLVIQHIGRHLKYWQLYDHDNERDYLLKQLNELRNINLDIQRNFSH